MNELQPVYWPWWAGAIALASLAVFHAVFLGRVFGVSGSLARAFEASTGVGKPAPHHVAFLVAIIVGAALAAVVAGNFSVRFDLGADFVRLIGDGPVGVVALLVGGTMTGFGTRLAHGCTSGHGLCGTSRLQPGSLVATATFFGVGIAVAYLLKGLS